MKEMRQSLHTDTMHPKKTNWDFMSRKEYFSAFGALLAYFILFVLFILLITQIIAPGLMNKNPSYAVEHPPVEIDDALWADKDFVVPNLNGSQILVYGNDSSILHQREWTDLDGNPYSLRYSVNLDDLRASKQLREGQFVDSTIWLTVKYRQLALNDVEFLSTLFNYFDRVKIQRNYDQQQFANMIASFVQDIPYVLTHQDKCKVVIQEDYWIRDYHQTEQHCLAETTFGLHSPLETISLLGGDCDSKTLLAYTILAHYDYQVAILSSETYAHAVLGVADSNILKRGVKHRGINYHAWEMTEAKWPIGKLSRDMSNLNRWEVVLENKVKNKTKESAIVVAKK